MGVSAILIVTMTCRHQRIMLRTNVQKAWCRPNDMTMGMITSFIVPAIMPTSVIRHDVRQFDQAT
jgi:hypothetical protein